MEPLKRLASYALIAGGGFLLFLGTRDFLESRLGQNEAQRDFEASLPRSSQQPAAPARRLERPKPGDAIAKLIIPRLDAQLYVVEGDDDSELRRGPGHMTGSAMPGSAGNCVIAGHRDTHFRVLKDIRKGDDIVLKTAHGEFLYRVKETQIVSPKNNRSLQPTPQPELHLITCYPFYYVGSAPKRFVVQAELAGAVANVPNTAVRPPS
jgi:sortase A